MNLRFRFALLFSLFVFIILMVSVTSIYLLYEEFRKNEFFERVKEKAEMFGNSYFDNDNVLVAGSKPAKEIPLTLSNEFVAFFDTSLNLLEARPIARSIEYPQDGFQKAKEQGFFLFDHGFSESVIFYFDSPGRKGFVVSSAYDKFGRRKIENLKIILLFTMGGGLVLSGLFAFFYVKQIVKPLAVLTNQMQRITESYGNERIVVTENNNELNRIARNFNDMLDRLEHAFEMRKRFVQQASHELRTPLTSMLAQTEAAIDKQLSHEESNAVFRSLKEDQQHLIELTNSLLLLSKYEKLPFITDLVPIRVDETLYEAIDSIKVLYPNCHITVNFTSMPENESVLTVMGNEVLFMSAIQNLIKNACHYSEDNEVNISIDARKTGMEIHFENTGKQLNEDEKERLFIPFFRGENSKNKKGFGLGLSIVQRIIGLHKGTVSYTAISRSLNRFSLSFPATTR